MECPWFWGPAEDEALKKTYSTLTSHEELDKFKFSFFELAAPSSETWNVVMSDAEEADAEATDAETPSTHGFLGRAMPMPRFDLDFLSHRLEHLLGPSVQEDDSNVFRTHWTKLDETNEGKFCIACLHLPLEPPRL